MGKAFHRVAYEVVHKSEAKWKKCLSSVRFKKKKKSKK